MDSLPRSTIDVLRNYDTPTMSNAIEAFKIRGKDEGFMGPEIGSIFPEMGVLVAFACTAKITAKKPTGDHRTVSFVDYVKSILSIPSPKVMVIQDLDYPKVIGSWWGEVNANLHKALGCIGVVTNGGVRDLPELKELNFNVFSPHVLVSHAYVRLTDIDTDLEIGGLKVSPGDLIHADRHGVLKIPIEIARRLPTHADRVQAAEKKFIQKCKSFDGDLTQLKNDHEKMLSERDNL